ncbi:MAG: response regulator [Myxococcales bacterium]
MATVLLVDDEADVRGVLRETLELDGHTVFEAPSGKAALTRLAEREFDLVLSDIRMPEGDGWSLLRELRRRDPRRPPVILITGFCDATAEEARKRGAQELVLKPCDVLGLLETVNAYVVPPSVPTGP